MTEYELIIETDKDCETNIDFIIEVKKRLEFIEQILDINVKKEKKNKAIKNGNEVTR